MDLNASISDNPHTAIRKTVSDKDGRQDHLLALQFAWMEAAVQEIIRLRAENSRLQQENSRLKEAQDG